MKAGSIVSVVLLVILSAIAAPARSQQSGAEACSGSQPEPGQSASWGVAFCNHTGHDLVVQFHDNDCPVQNWARRGDVYQKVIRKGETTTVFLCYASEPPKAVDPAPGIPKLRIPGGKGVVTTWTVVGDCGDRSDQSRVETRSFYDRGEFKTGIVLLQHPAGTAHCFGETAAAAPTPAVAAPHAIGGPPLAANPASTAVPAAAVSSPPAAPSVAAAPSPGATPAAATVAASPAAMSAGAAASYAASCGAGQDGSGARPNLCAAIDAQDVIKRTVYVFATTGADEPAYKCNITVELNFSDGTSWNDRFKADVASGQNPRLVSTRKYLKTVTKATFSNRKCTG